MRRRGSAPAPACPRTGGGPAAAGGSTPNKQHRQERGAAVTGGRVSRPPGGARQGASRSCHSLGTSRWFPRWFLKTGSVSRACRHRALTVTCPPAVPTWLWCFLLTQRVAGSCVVGLSAHPRGGSLRRRPHTAPVLERLPLRSPPRGLPRAACAPVRGGQPCSTRQHGLSSWAPGSGWPGPCFPVPVCPGGSLDGLAPPDRRSPP